MHRIFLKETDDCVALPELLKTRFTKNWWKCIVCKREWGSSFWTLDDHSNWEYCTYPKWPRDGKVKHQHSLQTELQRCRYGSDIIVDLQLGNDTKRLRDCLLGLPHRAMLYEGTFKDFFKAVVKELPRLLDHISAERGEIVYQFLRERKVTAEDNDDGKCDTKPQHLKSINDTCISCLDKTWIVHKSATFAGCDANYIPPTTTPPSTTASVESSSGGGCGTGCIIGIVVGVVVLVVIIVVGAIVYWWRNRKDAVGTGQETKEAKPKDDKINKNNEQKNNYNVKDSLGSYERLEAAADAD